jgi:hypothetical protein
MPVMVAMAAAIAGDAGRDKAVAAAMDELRN